MEGKDISITKGKSPLPHAEADQPQSIETYGGVFLAMQSVQATSEKSKEQIPPPQAQCNETNGGVLLVKEEANQAISKSSEKKPELQNNVRKKRSALHVLRVALFMLRRQSGKKSKSVQVEVASKGLWRKLVGSMRPLHLHDQQPQEPPAPAPAPPPALPSAPSGLHTSISVDSLQEMLSATMSPQRSYSPFSSPAASSSTSDSMSRYASTQSLQEFGRRAGYICDDEIEEEFPEGGDEMIDAKAEEFISNFYEQMRLQRLDSIKGYNEMSALGLDQMLQ